MLYRHLRTAQIFGANTEVGKTVISTALCRASALTGDNVAYLKPVGTGNLEQGGDDGHVAKYGKVQHKTLQTDCLFRFQTPVSPHLAAQRDAFTPPTDEEFVLAMQSKMDEYAQSRQFDSLYIETAGGVHSPTLNGTSQAEAFRPLRQPTILIASPALGGISTTLSAYESLLLRGYDIEAVLCFEEEYYENWKYLGEAFQKQAPNTHFAALPRPPAKTEWVSEAEDASNMRDYYDSLCRQHDALPRTIEALRQRHAERIEKLNAAGQRARDVMWWPFLQHAHVKSGRDVTVIDSAHGDYFHTFNNSAEESQALLQHTFDASASWWTQCLGHARTELTMAAAHAAGRYGHVIFPQAVQEPALQLADRLVNSVGKGWASKVFFSDDGSTGMEVALKMALRAFSKRYNVSTEMRSRLSILGLKGSYHGDTIGAMDAAEASVYSQSVEWHKGRGFWFDPPSVVVKGEKAIVRLTGSQWTQEQSFVFDDLQAIYDVDGRRTSELADLYKGHILRTLRNLKEQKDPMIFGALVLEPAIMGAGGMIFVDPLFQRILGDTIRSAEAAPLLYRPEPECTSGDDRGWQNMPVVYDEVFAGLHRVGSLSAKDLIGCSPDVACYAKILTGGLVPMSVTLASQALYDVFLGESKIEALLHGHSYTAYPIGCAVANKTLEMIERIDWSHFKTDWISPSSKKSESIWSLWNSSAVKEISRHKAVKGVMTLGTVLSVELEVGAGQTGYQSSVAADLLNAVRQKLVASNNTSIHARTLGDVFYIMCALNTPRDTLAQLEKAVILSLDKLS